jgi:hypothetical protein
MASVVLDTATMNRLAFIRMLSQQGVEQARRPEPLSFASLLSFHDCVELFLVLAVDHLRAPLPRRDPNFLDYWQILGRTETFPAGVELSGQPGMDRLNRYRNALKHAGAFPGREAVEDALTTTASFFENNTPVAFGVVFDAIDMTDVVPQDDARSRLKAAAATEAAGDRKEAMAQLAEAFADLFRPYAGLPFGRAEAYGFGADAHGGHGFPVGMGSAMGTVGQALRSNQARGLQAIGKKVDDNLAQLNDVVAAMQRGMRVMALGIDYARYNRFEQLTPKVSGAGEHRRVSAEFDYAPTRQEYDDCVQFVIAVALRLAQLEADAAQPSWRQARLGGPI